MGLIDFFKKGKEKPVREKVNAPSAARPNTPINRTVQPTPAPVKKYRVKIGDSLSKIAQQFYGNENDWQKIYDANKEKIKDPNLIRPGQEIIIP